MTNSLERTKQLGSAPAVSGLALYRNDAEARASHVPPAAHRNNATRAGKEAAGGSVNLAQATTGTIAGIVTRASDSASVAGATIKALQAGVVKATTTSAADGTYSLTGLAAGTYDLQITATGYEPRVQSGVTVSEQATTTANVNLDTSNITYIYDEVGRLVGVVEPNGESARYTYDEVGNLQSVTRQNSAAVSVIDFTPKNGLPGTVVTIYGTGFNLTPGQNSVQFNGVAAAVTSASATKIVTTVPATATTGLINITTPGGSASSTTPFTVASSGPVITSFSPTVGDASTPVNIEGSNFDSSATGNRVRFNGKRALVNTATTTSIAAAVPTGATSGRITINTSTGKGTSSDYFFAPPSPFTAADVEVTGQMAIGESKPVTITTANKIGLIVFEGTAGQRVSLRATGSTIASSIINIYNPDGTSLGSVTASTTAGFIDTRTLSTNGTYTILVDPQSTNTGSLTLNLYNAAETTGTVTPGSAAVTVTTTIPGQNARLTFNGTTGQRISLKVDNSTYGGGNSRVYIYNPDGTTLASDTSVNTGDFIDTKTLAATGAYSVLIDPESTFTGSMTLTLYDVPPDATTPITPTGTPTSVTTTVPGQNAKLTFEGTAGQRISLKVNSTTYGAGNSQLFIYNPDGTTLASDTSISAGDFIDTKTLSASGTYTIFVNPDLHFIGNMSVSLYDVVDTTGTITPGGAAVTVTTNTPGQNARLTFTGTTGQRVSLRFDATTYGGSNSRVYLYNPDGTVLASDTSVNAGDFIDTKTLPADGTYTILVDPEVHFTGSLTLTLSDVPNDVIGTITPGGAAVTVTTTIPGQNARLTFEGTAGQRISLKVDSTTYGAGNSQLFIYNPDGTTLASDTSISAGDFIDTKTLAATGTYTILIDPDLNFTGSMTLTLYDVPPDVVATTTPGNPATTLTTTVPGQNAKLTFEGTAGQRISLKVNSTTYGAGNSQLFIYNPDGTTLASDTSISAGDFIDTKTLSASGTYTIFVNPDLHFIGNMSVSLYDVVDTTGTITPGGAAVTVSIPTAGQNARLTFTGTTGQRISLKLSSVTISSSGVSIIKPDGTNLVAPTTINTSGGFIDTKTLPADGTYTILVDPASSNTGNMTLTLYDVPPDVSGTTSVGGAAVTVAIPVPGQNALLSFEGTAGQRASLRMTGVTIPGTTAVVIRKPDGTNLIASSTTTTGAYIDAQTLPVTGTYNIFVDPSTSNTGSITLTLNDANDLNGTITPGGSPVTVSIPTAGQNARLTFTGTTGQRISLKLSSVTISSSGVSIIKPDGTNLVAPTTINTSGGFIDTKTLPADGTYTILVDPASSNTGNMTLTLYDVPPDASGTITAGGAAVTVTTTVPGQNALLSFEGAAGQQVSLRITGVTIPGSTPVTIRKPDGTSLATVTTTTTGNYIDTKVLPTAGTYTIFVDPSSSNVGNITLTLNDATEVTGTITPGGSPVTVSIPTAGQNARLTFTGTTGQRISLKLSSVTISSSGVSIIKPDGTNLVAPTTINTSGGFIDTKTLPADGTYTILVDPASSNTGNMTLTLYDVPPDVSGTTSVGAPAVTVTTTVPGQNAFLTFSGAAGQQVTVRMTGNTMSTTTVKLLKPDGTTQTSSISSASSFNLTTQTLPTTGTYTISIDASGANIGSINVSVTTP